MNHDAMSEKHEAREEDTHPASRAQTPSIGQQSAEPGPETEEALCPLHLAMERIAKSAVSQALYYAQGEYAPRPELLRELGASVAKRRTGRHAHLPVITNEEGHRSGGDDGLCAHP